jgi:tRNA pseudouridine55 synthase
MNGIINVYKEEDFTSFDVVAKLRGILKQKKIGHTGTLDPKAQGVLPVCLGKSTKVCDLLTDKDKVYEAVMLLGITTDTQDMTGTILIEKTVACSEGDVRDVIMQFVGNYNQIPPMYSALKVNGQKLCNLARAGIEVERKPRPVHIFEIEIMSVALPRVTMRVHCSKGTYIRTLCQDIGDKLGSGACMESLLRTKVADFTLEHAYRLSEIEEAVKNGTIDDIIAPTDSVFLKYPGVTILQAYEKKLYNGNRLPIQSCEVWQAEWQLQPVRVYDMEHRFIGIYEYKEQEQELKPVKIFME